MKAWMHEHGVWFAVIGLSLACGVFGFSIATVQSRATRAIEININQAAFQSALDAKDNLINQLAGSAVRATGQAADATTAAADAAVTASDAADTAQRAAEAVQTKSAATQKTLGRLK